MSRTAAALVRGLIDRAGVPSDRILLSRIHSVDWQSLTFTGERHEIQLRIRGADCVEIANRLCWGISDAEFEIPGQIVADIAVCGRLNREGDGAVIVNFEALTIAE
jgi:hypothetical protein